MATNPSFGPSSRPGPAAVRMDANTAIREFGVTVATVSAALTQPSSRVVPSDRRIYLREPDPNASYTKLCFKIPQGPAFPVIDADNHNFEKKLNEIRMACKVWIKAPRGREPNHLVIYADNKYQLHDAFRAIHRMLKLADPDAEEKETAGMMAYLLYPLYDESTFVASVQVTPEDRPYLRAALVRDHKLSPESRSQYASHFLEEFEKIAAVLRRSPEKMQMRIHLGMLTFNQRPKSDEYHDKEWERLLRRVRQRKNTTFFPSIGSGDFAMSILSMICSLPDIFEATDTTTLALDKIQPQHCLIIISNDLHMETEAVPDDTDSNIYHHTPGRVYSIGNRHHRAGISTFCPEKKFDWHLNIMTENDVRVVPEPLIHFLRGIRMKKPTTEALVPNFPTPVFKKHTAKHGEVSQLIGKMTWQFGISGTPYAIEVSIQHQWDPFNMDAEAEKSCGICLVGLRWDQEMQYASTIARERDWGENFDRLFLQYEHQTGVESLLELIDTIQEHVAQIPDDDNVPDFGNTA